MCSSPGRSRDTEHRLAWNLWTLPFQILGPRQAERMRELLLPRAGQRWNPGGPCAGAGGAGAADGQTEGLMGEQGTWTVRETTDPG